MSSQLADSPEFFAILNGSLDPIGIVDAHGRFTWVNDAVGLFFGFEQNELIGTHFRDYLAEDEAPGDAMRRAQMGRPAAVVRRIRRHDGTIAVLRTELIPLGDQGEVLIHGTDLTTLYETLDRVSESESVLARAQEIGHTGSWVMRLPEQTVRWFGPVGDLVDAPTGSLISGGMVAERLVHPEDRGIPTRLVQQAIAEGASVGVFRIVVEGDLRWHRMYSKAELDEATGQPIRVEGVVHDITEDRAQDERYRELLDAVRVPMLIWTRRVDEAPAVIRYVNEPLCDLLGTTTEEMLGAAPSVWLDAGEVPELIANMARVAAGEHVPPLRIQMRVADGSYATCLLVASRVTYESREAICAQILDISEEVRLRAEAARARATYLALTVAAGVAHDFNNLLTGALGYLEIAVDGLVEDSPEARVVQAARLSVRRAANLAHALLGYSRSTVAGDREMDEAPPVIEVTDVMREAFVITRAAIDRRITMTMHNDDQAVHAAVRADSLMRVLVNLIVNARDATLEHGGGRESGYLPRIDLGVDVRAAEGILEVWVADNGVGIPDEIAERVFEPYFTTKVAGGGTGIGLHAARDLAQAVGGDLSFRTQVGVGTRFALLLPLVSASVVSDRS